MEYRFLGKLNHDKLKSLSYEECALLAAEIRKEMIDTVTANGGHLASNLGVVELTIALHRVFDCPKDRIIFDVSHQCYVHKLLTDRYERFSTLRQPGGLSGFQKRNESDCDAFGGGHASTSLSAALGFAEADAILGRDNYTVAVAGDGAFTGGMVHEAMNNCRSGLRLIFILNENEMSISPNIGGFARYIANVRTTEGYFGAKRLVRRGLSAIPGIGRGMVRFARNQKSRLKNLLYSTNYFEKLGFYYLGPCDGHDTERLERLLREAKGSERPVLLHIKTQKGHGYFPAENDPGQFHGIAARGTEKPESFSEHFGKTLTEIATHDARVCAITAAMRDGTGLVPFATEHPNRFFDVGIAEEHAMTFAGGLSAAGMHPVYAVYSTFLQRCYDQLIHDISLQNLPLTIAVDRAGLAVSDGATHHGLYDVSMALSIANSEIYAPLTFSALDRILSFVVTNDKCSFVRYRSGGEFPSADTLLPYRYPDLFLRCTEDEKPDAVIITYGQIATEALLAKEKAASCGITVRVIVLEKLSAKRDIIDGIRALLGPRVRMVCFLEEGMRNGGLGEQFRELFRLLHIRYRVLAIDDSTVSFNEDQTPYETFGISHKDLIKELSIPINTNE